MTAWLDGYWQSSDGLRLHYRDYNKLGSKGSRARPPILCIPGLTRNVRDFDNLAQGLLRDWRVIAVDLRGRGESAYAKDAITYAPQYYIDDLGALLRSLGLDRFILLGTSLGGLLGMLLAQKNPRPVVGAIINDIGPVIDSHGLDRIKSSIGRSQSWPTWMHAARYFAEAQQEIFPQWGLDRWLAFAKRVCKLGPQGRILLDYDIRIAEQFKAAKGETRAPFWSAFRVLAKKPLLVIRGAHSDLLSVATLAKMQTESPDMTSVTVPNVGHAPTLEEPEAIAAIGQFLKRIEAHFVAQPPTG